MKVIMLKANFPNSVGDVVDVNESTATRWISRGICRKVDDGGRKTEKVDSSRQEAEEELEETKYNDLRRIAKEKGVNTNGRPKKPFLIREILRVMDEEGSYD